MYKARRLLWYRYDLIRTGLSKSGYHDKPEIILYGMMNTLVDYVEVEKCFEVVDFEHGEPWKSVGITIREIYAWWKEYPDRQEEISISLDNWHKTTFTDDKTNPLDVINSGVRTDESERHNDIQNYLENKLKEEEQEMLLKLIKIREYLWT